MLLFAPEREYETLPVKCVLEIRGEKYIAVYSEYRRHLFWFDEKMDAKKDKTTIRKFQLDRPIIGYGIHEIVLFNGMEINCYWCNDGKTLIQI